MFKLILVNEYDAAERIVWENIQTIYYDALFYLDFSSITSQTKKKNSTGNIYFVFYTCLL